MGKHRRTSDDGSPLAPGDSGATYWSVDDARWPAVRPSLPAELADLLAPPIVVGVARVAATSRLTPPAGLVGRPARTTTVRSGAAAGTTSRPDTPAVSRPAAGAPAGTRTGSGRRPGSAPTGRHRSAAAPLDRAG